MPAPRSLRGADSARLLHRWSSSLPYQRWHSGRWRRQRLSRRMVANRIIRNGSRILWRVWRWRRGRGRKLITNAESRILSGGSGGGSGGGGASFITNADSHASASRCSRTSRWNWPARDCHRAVGPCGILYTAREGLTVEMNAVLDALTRPQAWRA
jgi:hypothetical protein